MTLLRVGHGFDVHAFTEGDHLIIGGVRIPFDCAFKAHSDGDVLLHAITDAILGAAAMGDIGRHFPDTDSAYAGIDSRLLLRKVVELVAERGWKIGNLDATVVAQAPKLSPHIEAMRLVIAEDLKVELDAVNVKATTSEQLGFTGRSEGIASFAVVMLSR